MHFKLPKRFPYHPCGHHPERFARWAPFIIRFSRWECADPAVKRLGWNIWIYSPTRTWLGELGFYRRPQP